jgi:UDP-galactopyranose mutase
MPLCGYHKLFENMLAHRNIEVRLGISYEDTRHELRCGHIIYTGPIDNFFNCCLGTLPYRSLRFEHQFLPELDMYQCVGTVNFPNDYEYTRITEFKHLTGQSCRGTSIVREFPTNDGDPYYPIPSGASETLYQRYKALAADQKHVTFVGRLAEYRYYNMDQVVGAALAAARSNSGAG